MTGPSLPRPVPGSNAIGFFQIGVSQIGTISPFDPWTSIQAQYANSEILTTLIINMSKYIDPTQWFEEFWSDFMNLPTAFGEGLNVLGRIVGVGRVLQVAGAGYFGFEEALPGPLPFNVGVFYTGGGTTSNFALADAPYRVLILAKALANISDGSMRSINALLSVLFPGRGNAYCTNGQDLGPTGAMTMTLTFDFTLTNVELAIIELPGLIPVPVGVSFTVVQT